MILAVISAIVALIVLLTVSPVTRETCVEAQPFHPITTKTSWQLVVVTSVEVV